MSSAQMLERARGPQAPPKSGGSELTRLLGEIGAQIQQTKLDKGWTVTGPDAWAQENQIPADLALIHSEVSEALEAFRKADADGFDLELADIFIRLVGLSHGLGIDLGNAVERKMAKNSTRAYRHGGKRL